MIVFAIATTDKNKMIKHIVCGLDIFHFFFVLHAFEILIRIFGCQLKFSTVLQVLYTATSLGLFDELSRNSSPTSAGVLASTLGLHPDSTERLLNACVALSLVVKTFDANGQGMSLFSLFLPCPGLLLH